jgi:hypothetical protein
VQSLFNHHQPSRDHRAIRVIKQYVGNLPPMRGVFPDYPAPVERNADTGRELTRQPAHISREQRHNEPSRHHRAIPSHELVCRQLAADAKAFSRTTPTSHRSRWHHESVTSPRCKVYRKRAQLSVQGDVVIEVLYLQLSKAKKEDLIMRLLIVAAAATLVITGTAMAEEPLGGTNAKGAHHHHHHFRDANASVADSAAPIDTLSAHDLHMENLRDSGYNPASDFNAAGNVNTSW